MTGFRPLLAAGLPIYEDEIRAELEKLHYPIYASAKIDGIRVLNLPGRGPVTRKLIDLPNKKLRKFLSDLNLDGLDGEITFGPPAERANKTAFNTTQSFVMSFDPDLPFDFTFSVFDDFSDPTLPFRKRLQSAIRRVSALSDEHIALLHQHPFREGTSPDDIFRFELTCLDQGYEGIMIRSADGDYKYGRSTLRQQILLKMKRWVDDEAVIIGFKKRKVNLNEQKRDELGYAKRSHSKKGMVEVEELGAFVVRCGAFTEEFDVGSGLTDEERKAAWANRKELKGKTLAFKYQPVGVLDKPRFPIYKGMRKD